MSATGSDRGFTNFEKLCQGEKGYSDNLAKLFDVSATYGRQPISFDQAEERLHIKIKDIFIALQIGSSRSVTDFVIGKTFVKKKKKVVFNPMRRTTWYLDDGINGRWRSYRKDGYDGLVVIGCIEKFLIPDDVMKFNKSMNMDQQVYTLGLEQALIHYYTFKNPDSRLRNKSLSIGKMSETVFKGYVVYVAYKLEPEQGGYQQTNGTQMSMASSNPQQQLACPQLNQGGYQQTNGTQMSLARSNPQQQLACQQLNQGGYQQTNGTQMSMVMSNLQQGMACLQLNQVPNSMMPQ